MLRLGRARRQLLPACSSRSSRRPINYARVGRADVLGHILGRTCFGNPIALGSAISTLSGCGARGLTPSPGAREHADLSPLATACGQRCSGTAIVNPIAIAEYGGLSGSPLIDGVGCRESRSTACGFIGSSVRRTPTASSMVL